VWEFLSNKDVLEIVEPHIGKNKGDEAVEKVINKSV
jgi:hypothetical protein